MPQQAQLRPRKTAPEMSSISPSRITPSMHSPPTPQSCHHAPILPAHACVCTCTLHTSTPHLLPSHKHALTLSLHRSSHRPAVYRLSPISCSPQASLASGVYSGCFLFNSYMRRSPEPGMLMSYFVVDEELGTLSLVSLASLSAQLHAPRSLKIMFVSGSL